MKKKISAVLLAVCVITGSVLCLTGGMEVSAAQARVEESQDWRWTELEDGTVSIMSYDGMDTEVTIPSVLDGKAVTDISPYTFSLKSDMTSITIPEGVTRIGDFAFSFCNNLSRVTIPEGVRSIGKGAFEYCDSLTGITLPDSVTDIGDEAFRSSMLPKGGLEHIRIPAKVSSLGRNPFRGCYHLQDIEVDAANPVYTSENGVLFNREKTELLSYPAGNSTESYEIPDGVKKIAYAAFSGAEDLRRIHIPSSVTDIGERSFEGVWQVEDITLPEGLVSIGRGAFSGCGITGTVRIPSSVVAIGSMAFDSIGLTAIEVDGDNQAFSSEDGILFNKEKTGLLAYPFGKGGETYEIPSSVTFIGEAAFYDNGFTHITLPENVTRICDKAFCSAESDIKITILNPQCEIVETEEMEFYPTYLTIPHDAVICGHDDSTAQSYASAHGNAFQSLDKIQCQHKYTTVVTKASMGHNGSIQKRCSSCGELAEKKTIYSPKTISLSKKTIVYNGKRQKISVTVKDSAGKKVDAGNYTVKYTDNKNVGEAAAVITFKGRYEGSVSKTFRIIPKPASLTRVEKGSKTILAKWKKQTVQTTGYQIQYSADRKFRGNTGRIIKTNKNKITSQRISGLEGRKKYYVRIRTYKTVKVNGKRTEICSKWSKAKSVIVK